MYINKMYVHTNLCMYIKVCSTFYLCSMYKHLWVYCALLCEIKWSKQKIATTNWFLHTGCLKSS